MMRLTFGIALLAWIGHCLEGSTVPLFMWSPKAYFSSTCKEGVADVVKSTDVSEGIAHLSEETKSPSTSSLVSSFSSLSTQKQPEAFIAFMYPKLDTATAAKLSGGYHSSSNRHEQPLAFLSETMENANSCLFVPYVVPSSDLSESLISTFANTEVESTHKPTVVNMQMTDCSSVVNKINKNDHLLNNGVTDLFLIKLGSENLDAGCVKKVFKAVSSHTSNYIALLSADTGKPITLNFEDEVREEMQVPEMANFASVDAAPANVVDPIDVDNVKQYSIIVVAIPISLFMLLMLWIGVCCLMDIETPVRFPQKNLHISTHG